MVYKSNMDSSAENLTVLYLYLWLSLFSNYKLKLLKVYKKWQKYSFKCVFNFLIIKLIRL